MPIWAIEKANPQKSVIKTSLEVNTHLLYILSKADILGRICNDQKDLLYKIELFKALCQENDCYGKAKDFSSNYSRYFYLNKAEASPNHEYFDETKFQVTVMCALPGTGKDYFIQKNLSELPVLSLDEIRRREKISPTDSKKQGLVIQLAKEQAKVFMRKKQDFVFNATNISKDRRSKWISLFKEYGARIKIIYLEVPYKQLFKQNKDRKHQVPDSVIYKMMNQWEIPNYEEAVVIEWKIQTNM